MNVRSEHHARRRSLQWMVWMLAAFGLGCLLRLAMPASPSSIDSTRGELEAIRSRPASPVLPFPLWVETELPEVQMALDPFSESDARP